MAGVAVIAPEDVPDGPFEVFYALHEQAMPLYRGQLMQPDETWEQPYVLDVKSIPVEARTMSRRKIALHALLHSQRHWAQLATLLRQAGFPTELRGDLLFSSVIR